MIIILVSTSHRFASIDFITMYVLAARLINTLFGTGAENVQPLSSLIE